MKDALEQADQERERSRFQEAERLYRLAARRRETRAEGLLGAADCCRLLGRFPQALDLYTRAIPHLKTEDPDRLADAELGRALAFRGMGRPQEALRILKRVEARYRSGGDVQGMAFVAWALGGTLRIAGSMREAKKQLEQALKLYRQAKNSEGLAYVSCALGGVARMLGDYGASRRHYRYANAAMRRRKDTFGTAYSYCGLGNACRMKGDYPGALAYFKKAEKVYAGIGDKVSYAYTLWSMATTLKLLGKKEEALRAFQRSAVLFRATSDPRGLAYAEMGMAELDLMAGAFGPGVNHLSRAQSLAAPFAWESLHVRWLCGSKADYARTGSKFRPVKLPVNWP